MPGHRPKKLFLERMGVAMQKRKWEKTKVQEKPHQLLQKFSKQFDTHYDPVGHQTPELGVEALIATIDSKRELQKALKEMIIRKKLQKSSLSEKN
jgi:hypothetical protein